MKVKCIALVISLFCIEANAGSTLDAAIGGGLGGAAGAAIGNEVGGRDGAIIGGAIGGAVGAAVTTDEHPEKSASPAKVRLETVPVYDGHPHRYHCPPGQRKKGRC